jgi:hypothetical protein
VLQQRQFAAAAMDSVAADKIWISQSRHRLDYKKKGGGCSDESERKKLCNFKRDAIKISFPN